MHNGELDEAFHGSVTVGERGQVVIPASVREMIGVSAGEKLLVFAHPSGSGVLFMKLEGIQDMVARFTPLIQAMTQGEIGPLAAEDESATES